MNGFINEFQLDQDLKRYLHIDKFSPGIGNIHDILQF